LPALVGLATGSLVLFLVSFRVLSSYDQTRQGYINAIAVGLLLMMSIEFIPTALSEVEFASYSLIATFIDPLSGPGADIAPWPIHFQVVVRSLGVAAILILFLRGNAPITFQEKLLLSEQDAAVTRLQRLARWLALPAANQTDWIGIVIVALALGCYNLWLGVQQGPVTAGSEQFIGITLLTFLSVILGMAIWGLVSISQLEWRWLVLIPCLIGLATILGLTQPVEWIILGIAPLLLALGTICMVYGIGRLLRIIQDQIGLGWRTTLTVGVGAVALYLGNQVISRLI